MILLPKCRAFYVVLENGHGAGKKGMTLEKRAWRGAMLKLARGNTTISTLIPSLKKIGKGMPKIESEKQFLTSIKGRNSVLICKTRTLLPNINSSSKFEQNWLKNAPSRVKTMR